MMKKSVSNCMATISFWLILIFTLCSFFLISVHANALEGHGGTFVDHENGAHLVKKDQRKLIVSTEYGQISAVKILTTDGPKGITGSSYHLQFITLEPNALLLPLLLHADMLFYVNTGSAELSYVDLDENELQHISLRRGDVYRLQAGTFFFIQSNLESERQKLRIYAIFTNSNENSQKDPSISAYSTVHDLLLGFDNRVLQAAFNVPEDVIAELKTGQPQPLIVHGVQKSKKTLWEVETQFIRSLLGRRNYGLFDFNNKGKKTKVFNVWKAKPDVENCNGWSLSVTKKQLKALKHSDMGVFMVNLTTGAMMGPHWNPMATEIGVVLQGRGMIRIVCSSNASETGCKNMRFRVEEGDVFAILRFHPMAQISFNKESFVFMGFTTASKKNHPQFLAGKRSVLQTLDKLVLAASFQVSNETVEQLLASQEESIILECTSCAENEEALMEEEIEREREEERRREEEEARKREEEKRREEEEARKREEEEAKRKEEEKRRREEEEEEARRREEEEEAARREEERRRKEAEQEEEAARKQEEEAARRQEEERERRREEEAARKEERRREEAEQEEEAARRQEEEQARQQEQERERRQEEEAARKEEETRREEAEQEAAAARRQEEEQARQQAQERERQQEEEAARKEEERRRQEEEEARQQEDERERQQQEEEAEREEERSRREAEQEEEAARRQEEEEREGGRREQEGEEGEEEAARREEEERERRAAEEETEAARERETEGEEGRRVLRRSWRV